MSRTYSREEVDEILRRAAVRGRGRDEEPTLSRAELVDAAREAGIDEGAVHAAADEVETGVAAERIPTEDEAVAAWQARHRRQFNTHLLTWLVVCTGLLVINLLAGGALWFQWPLAGWGIAVALQAVGTFRSATPEQITRVKERHRKKTQEARKRIEKQQRKLETEQRSAMQQRAKEQRRLDRARRQDAAALFEVAVEEGVAALMQVATRTLTKVSQRSRNAERKETDFDRYVAARQSRQGRPQRMAVRVAAGDGAAPVASRPETTVRIAEELDHEVDDEAIVQHRRR